MELETYTLKQIRTLYDENIDQKKFAELVGIEHVRYQRLERYELRLLASELISIGKLMKKKNEKFDIYQVKC